MKRHLLLALCVACAGAAYAGGFTITTSPRAQVVVNSTVSGRLVTTRGHLARIESSAVGGMTTITVTVTP